MASVAPSRLALKLLSSCVNCRSRTDVVVCNDRRITCIQTPATVPCHVFVVPGHGGYSHGPIRQVGVSDELGLGPPCSQQSHLLYYDQTAILLATGDLVVTVSLRIIMLPESQVVYVGFARMVEPAKSMTCGPHLTAYLGTLRGARPGRFHIIPTVSNESGKRKKKTGRVLVLRYQISGETITRLAGKQGAAGHHKVTIAERCTNTEYRDCDLIITACGDTTIHEDQSHEFRSKTTL